jgi:hypothetical protein
MTSGNALRIGAKGYTFNFLDFVHMMKQSLTWIIIPLLLLAFMDGGIRVANAKPLTFQIVARDGDTVDGKSIGSLSGPLALNNRHEVAFHASFQGGSGFFTTEQGFLVGDGETIEGTTLIGTDIQPSLNNHGTVVLNGFFAGGTGLFTPTTRIAGTGDVLNGYTLFGTTAGVVNDRGTVAFLGTFLGGNGLFTTRDGLIAASGDTIDDVRITHLSGGLSLNRWGRLAFAASISSDLTQTAIFTPETVIAASGDTLEGDTIVRVANPVITNRGEVLFHVTAAHGQALVSTVQNIVVRTGDSVDGLTVLTLGDLPSINTRGEVAFSAGFSSGSGILTTWRGVVLKTGDELAGKIVLDVDEPVINRHGAVAVRVIFTDTHEAIVLATP